MGVNYMPFFSKDTENISEIFNTQKNITDKPCSPEILKRSRKRYGRKA